MLKFHTDGMSLTQIWVVFLIGLSFGPDLGTDISVLVPHLFMGNLLVALRKKQLFSQAIIRELEDTWKWPVLEYFWCLSSQLAWVSIVRI